MGWSGLGLGEVAGAVDMVMNLRVPEDAGNFLAEELFYYGEFCSYPK